MGGFYFLSFPFFNFLEAGLFNGLRGIQILFFQSCAHARRYALPFWLARHSANGEGRLRSII
jgi:hypothetical protein